jgi:hypothetical protein
MSNWTLPDWRLKTPSLNMSLQQIMQAVEHSGFSLSMRESPYWFLALNLTHMLGLLVAAGTVVFWDLRLLGLGLRTTPVSEVGKSLLPWTWTGFGVMFVSGSLLVVMEAGRLYDNIYFRLKVVALLLAGLNVMMFHLNVYRSVNGWDTNVTPPLQARMAGGFSLLLWFTIMACGRAIGYTLDYAA